jgi:hypothetical protein
MYTKVGTSLQYILLELVWRDKEKPRTSSVIEAGCITENQSVATLLGS